MPSYIMPRIRLRASLYCSTSIYARLVAGHTHAASPNRPEIRRDGFTRQYHHIITLLSSSRFADMLPQRPRSPWRRQFSYQKQYARHFAQSIFTPIFTLSGRLDLARYHHYRRQAGRPRYADAADGRDNKEARASVNGLLMSLPRTIPACREAGTQMSSAYAVAERRYFSRRMMRELPSPFHRQGVVGYFGEAGPPSPPAPRQSRRRCIETFSHSSDAALFLSISSRYWPSTPHEDIFRFLHITCFLPKRARDGAQICHFSLFDDFQ